MAGMDAASLHEDLRERPVALPSERQFGWVMAGAFLVLGGLPMLWGGSPRIWLWSVAAVFAAITWFRPSLLRPLNLLWFRLGQLLQKIVSPIFLGLVFFGIATPTALLRRALHRNPMGLRWDRGSASYWIERPTARSDRETLRNQF